MTAPLTADAHAYGLDGGRVSGNDFGGNASAATRFDSAPSRERRRDNDG